MAAGWWPDPHRGVAQYPEGKTEGAGWHLESPGRFQGQPTGEVLGNFLCFRQEGLDLDLGGCALTAEAPGYKGALSQATLRGPIMTALRLLAVLASLLATSRAGECPPQARCLHLCRGSTAGDRPGERDWRVLAPVSQTQGSGRDSEATRPRPHRQAGPDQPWEGGDLSF